MPINAGGAATYGAGPVAGRAGYDVPRGGGSQVIFYFINLDFFGFSCVFIWYYFKMLIRF
jgi:hypothetical protein